MPATENQVMLLARCVNEACERNDPESERYQQTWDVPAKVEEKVEYGTGAFARTPLTATQHTVPEDDEGLWCPDCGRPASVTTGEPVAYPKMIN